MAHLTPCRSTLTIGAACCAKELVDRGACHFPLGPEGLDVSSERSGVAF